jgi:hypothetical protein
MAKRAVLAACVLALVLGIAIAGLAAAAALSPGRPGGVLKVLTREDLTQAFLIHESATLATIWPAQWRYDYFAHWPQVKNLVPHHTPYSYGRMQDVWLDR